MRLNNKLSDWNIGLIAVGAILFVGGVSFAVVLLFLRIKASCMLLTIMCVICISFDWDNQTPVLALLAYVHILCRWCAMHEQ